MLGCVGGGGWLEIERFGLEGRGLLKGGLRERVLKREGNKSIYGVPVVIKPLTHRLPLSFRPTSGVIVVQEQFSLILLYTMLISISSVLSREYYHYFDITDI